MIGTVIVNPSEDEETNATETPEPAESSKSMGTTSSMNSLAIVPTLLVIALVSRYLK